jgi:hypothetical protein
VVEYDERKLSTLCRSPRLRITSAATDRLCAVVSLSVTTSLSAVIEVIFELFPTGSRTVVDACWGWGVARYAPKPAINPAMAARHKNRALRRKAALKNPRLTRLGAKSADRSPATSKSS